MNITSMDKNKTIIAIVVGAVLVAGAGAGVMYAIQSGSEDAQSISAPVVQQPPSQPGKPLKPGKYDFNILGGKTVPVTLDPCGPDCLILNTPPSESNPDGFKRELRKEGNIYSGVAPEAVGIVCAADGQAHPAETKYTVRADGTAGMVAVLGEPCGPGVPNVPLGFTLTQKEA